MPRVAPIEHPSIGECIAPEGGSVSNLVTGQMRLSYFIARRSETISKVLMTGVGAGSGGSVSLDRVGIYTVDPATFNLTALIASTASDTGLAAAINEASPWPKAFGASWQKQAGVMYALARLVVHTHSTNPSVAAFNAQSSAQLFGTQNRRRRSAVVSSLSDLPSTVTSGFGATTQVAYGLLIP